MTISNTMPDAGTDPETMSLEAVQAELAGYQPATEFGVVDLEAHRERRRALWRRLDALARPGGGGQPER
jgi:hypothetical protein